MSQITLEEVYKLARLSHLQLSEDEAERMQGEISRLLEFVERLQRADLSGLEPTYQVSGLANVTRDDEIIDYGVSPAELLKNAPSQRGGSLEVKRVL